MLAGLRGLRAPGPVEGHGPVPGLPARSAPAGGPAGLPEVRPARPAARGHRVVRALLAPPPGQAAAPYLQRLRRAAAPCRTGLVLAVLAASPGPPVRPGLEPRRPAAEPAGLAGGLHRSSRGSARPCPRLHHDHRAGPTAGRRAPRPSAGRPGACPPPRTVDGLPRPRLGGLLHRPGPGAADRPGRAARRRAAPAAHRRRSRAAAPGRRVVCRVHAPGPGTGPAGRHHATGRRDDRDRAGDRPRPRPVHGRPSRQARLGARRRARHRGVPGHPAQGPQAPADSAPPVLPLRPGPEDRPRRPDTRAVPPGSPPGSPGRLSCWPGSASFSAAGQSARTPTRTRPCSGSSPWCTERPASRSAACAWTTSTTAPGPSGWARDRTQCRSTPPAETSCSAASPTAMPRPPGTRT
jgi:hypothetical protein